MNTIEIGRLLRAGNSGFVVGCRVSQLEDPTFGSLVHVNINDDYRIYGLIHEIHIDEDGLVRQLATADKVDESVIADNRINRNVPLEMSVLAVGYSQENRIYHLLPPRPPLSLDMIYLSDPEELHRFTSAGHFGYFRHLLRNKDLPVGELLAAHLQQAQSANTARGDPDWINRATQELISLLRDDYPVLMETLGAVRDFR
jgi:hypothetical protein